MGGSGETTVGGPPPQTRTDSPGALFRLIRHGHARTRAELAASTGLARSTVAQRVELLMAGGLVTEVGDAPSTGGRKPAVLGFNPRAGVVLVADLGATHSRLAVCGLDGLPLAQATADIPIADGPEQVLEWVTDGFDRLLVDLAQPTRLVLGVAIGVPGPVDFLRGQPVNPPIMPGWHGVPIRPYFANHYSVPVLVDNDVNLLALGEHAALDASVDDLVFVKVGTGIGSGLIMSGQIHRGSRGAAGDLGHVQVGPNSVLCSCGNHGCLEAVAGGGALARQLTEAGHDTPDARAVARLARNGSPDALAAVRAAGRTIGKVLATTVNLLNPSMIILGGDLADAGDNLLAGVREVVYNRATTLGTTELILRAGSLGDLAGVRGGAAMILDHVLAPHQIDAVLTSRAASA